MGNIVIGTPELSDAATLYPSTETTAGPATSLQTMQPTDVWEAGGGAPYIEIDLGAVSNFNLIALLFTNATGADQWRVRTANTQGALVSAPVYDSNYEVVSYVGSEGHVFMFPGALSNRWVRIDLIAAVNPFMAGRLYISNAFQPTINYDYGGEDGYDDDTLIDVTDGGNLIPNDGANRAIVSFTLNLSDETERHTIREINKARGAQDDVVVITDPDAAVNKADVIYYGLLQRRRAAITTVFNRNKIGYQLTAF
jgi:hypothetical protein